MNRQASNLLRSFWAPRYWPTWFFLGLLRALCLLPYSWLQKLGDGLGTLSYWFIPSRRRIASINLQLAYPQLDANTRTALVKSNFRSIAFGVFETALAWWASEKRLRDRVEIEGMEHVKAALAAGKGLFLLGAHYTTLDISGRLLSMHMPLQITYKRARNPLFDAVMLHYRQRIYENVIESRDLRSMLRALKKNRVCWYAPDQDFGKKNTVFAPFMSVPTTTLTTTARIAQRSGACVCAFWHERLPKGRGYRLRISAPLDHYPSGDEWLDARRYNQTIEEQVKRTPEQYFWVHRRFKTRPEGEAHVYNHQ